jgi:hypothetical protein
MPPLSLHSEAVRTTPTYLRAPDWSLRISSPSYQSWREKTIFGSLVMPRWKFLDERANHTSVRFKFTRWVCTYTGVFLHWVGNWDFGVVI